MSDVKDILGISRPSADVLEGKPQRQAKEPKAQRPAGMSREAFALLGESHPITPSALAEELKKDQQGLAEKRKAKSGPVTWQCLPFANQARSDSLQLRHWVKCAKDAQGLIRPVAEGDYPFAKMNKKIMVYRYDDEEWNHITPVDTSWSRAETDYLLDMCQQFDLRFLVIADRWNFEGGQPRTLEQLKGRYYSIARGLMVTRAGGEELIANETLVKHPFNEAHELQRKEALEALLARGRNEEAAEDETLAAAKVIENKRKAEANARRPAAAPVADFVATSSFEDDPGPGVPSLFDADLQAFRPPPGVYMRGGHAKEMADAQLARVTGPPRHQKAVEALLQEAGLVDTPRMPTRSICGAWLAARAEAIAMADSRRGGGSSTPAATPSAPAPAVSVTPAAAVAAGTAPAATAAAPVAAAAPAAAAEAVTPAPSAALRATSGTPEGSETPGMAGRAKRSHKGKTPARYEDTMTGATPRSDKRPRTSKKGSDD